MPVKNIMKLNMVLGKCERKRERIMLSKCSQPEQVLTLPETHQFISYLGKQFHVIMMSETP
jgi:hypothetical protein